MTWWVALSLLACWPGPAAYSLPKLLVLSVGVAWTAYSHHHRRLPGADDLLLPMLLMAGAMLLSTMNSVDPYSSWLGRHHEWTRGILGMAVVGGAYAAAHVAEDISPLQWAGAVTGVICCLQWALGHGQAGPWGPRAIGLVGHPVYCGAALAAILPLTLNRPRLLVPIAFGLLACGSRGPILGALAAVLYLW